MNAPLLESPKPGAVPSKLAPHHAISVVHNKTSLSDATDPSERQVEASHIAQDCAQPPVAGAAAKPASRRRAAQPAKRPRRFANVELVLDARLKDFCEDQDYKGKLRSRLRSQPEPKQTTSNLKEATVEHEEVGADDATVHETGSAEVEICLEAADYKEKLRSRRRSEPDQEESEEDVIGSNGAERECVVDDSVERAPGEPTAVSSRLEDQGEVPGKIR